MSIDMRILAKADRKAFHDLRRSYQRHQRTFSKELRKIPHSEWPPTRSEIIPSECWRSRDFLVQIFRKDDSPVRLSICRTAIESDGSWKAGITWDEIQEIKADVGFREEWAVEIFPPDQEVVNVANLRHIWIVPMPSFAWRKELP
jgi:hypothetical protein